MAEPKIMTPEEKEIQKRRILFVPCKTKVALRNWIKLFLGLDMPDCIVDPDSNSTPMDMIWEVYSKALANDDPKFVRVLYYAGRGSYKSVAASILEVLSVFHLGRDTALMCAIESQSSVLQGYIRNHLSRPILKEFLEGDNKQMMHIVRYDNTVTGEIIPPDAYSKLSENERRAYQEVRRYIKVVICTKAGANSTHVSLFLTDELDTIQSEDSRAAFEESRMIPTSFNGKRPITVLTSSRKWSFGLVQKEIDKAFDANGNERLKIRKWNLIDVTARCPESRHRPDLPKLPLYVDDTTLRSINASKYESLSPEAKKPFVEYEGFAGCETCDLFSACKTRLATNQKSESSLLRPIDDTIATFFDSGMSIETAQAQLLCRKPSSQGLIYPNFERSVHMLTATQMAEKISGEPQKQGMTKSELIAFMKARDMRFGTGVDFGYTHLFAAATGAIDGYRAFIFDVIAAAHLETSQQIEALESIRHLSPSLYPDTAYPGSLAALKKAGFRVVDWKKTPGSVVDGINIIRTMMMPPLGAEPRLYLLAGDPQCELLAKHLGQYHWKLDAASEPTDTPDEKDDDILDAVRYLLMNLFSVARGRVQVATSNETGGSEPYEDQPGVYTRENWAKKILEEATQGGDPGNGGLEGKKGSVKWSF